MAKRKLRYDPKRDYYDILGVNPAASQPEVQQRYRELAKKYHPDLNPERVAWATEQFQRLNEAYDVLNDSRTRSDYDDLRWLSGKPRVSGASQEKWWEQPHQREAGYQPRYDPIRPVRPPVERPGKWLTTIGLGFIRPFYAAIVDLMRSPYRYLLTILGIVLLVNLAFIMGTLANYESDEDAATPLPTAQAVSGEIPDRTLQIVNCYPEVTLLVRSIEQAGQVFEMEAQIYPPGTPIEGSPLLFHTDGLSGNPRILGTPLLIRLTLEDSLTRHQSGTTPLTTSLLEPGNYVLQWSPQLLGVGQPDKTCTQPLVVQP